MINQTTAPTQADHLPEKATLKASDVCSISLVSKPKLYGRLKHGKLWSFKIKSQQCFLRTDIETMT